MATTPNPQIGTLTTSSATIYTPSGSNKGYVVAGSFANTTTISQTVTIQAVISSVTKTLVNAAVIPANGSLTLGPELKPIVLKNGDSLKALASNNSAVDFYLSAVETA